MLRRWIPWKYLVSRLARSGGFIDPIKILFRIEAFSQPIDIQVPLEMLRSGMVFHARGFLNTVAIQHNLDWIWPYWVERQYNPLDISFVPRSFLITHINITHRNWTAIGLPDFGSFCIVDPRGLLTPFWDSWSLDAWIVSKGGNNLYPSQIASSVQHLDLTTGLAVMTRSWMPGMDIISRSEVIEIEGVPTCVLSLKARGPDDSWLAVSVRPYNPEGVSFINTIALGNTDSVLEIDGIHEVQFEPLPEHHRFSYYRHGDVHTHLFDEGHDSSVSCRVGMATAAMLYSLEDMQTREVRVKIPLRKMNARAVSSVHSTGWDRAIDGLVPLDIPEKRFMELFEGAVRIMVLLAPDSVVYPGPYTYKRFWFRDAAFILNALSCIGMFDRVEKILDSYPGRQIPNGYYLSQEGEWDSNGEALWTISRFCQLSGRPPKESWKKSILKGANWILNKRLPADSQEPHAGLFPPGFSAEHLGPNDYYYWDDFWGVAGLRAAAHLMDLYEDIRRSEKLMEEADLFLKSIEQSLFRAAQSRDAPGMPASPYRRMDSGAIGSLVAGYPLGIFPERDARLMDTVDFLLKNCMVNDGFFLDIIHSGINPYLSLHLAQVLMRAGRVNSLDLFRTVSDLASPTGQWPEAVHPRTLGGCMGDGNHAWAAAEWVMMIRNSFLREEGNRLILGSGIFPSWYRKNRTISFGPAPTVFGPVTVEIKPTPEGIVVQWSGTWRKCPPSVEVSIPGFDRIAAGPHDDMLLLSWKGER